MKHLTIIVALVFFSIGCKKEETSPNISTSNSDSNINKPAYLGTTPLSGTPTISSITTSSAIVNSQIMNDGNLVVTTRGIIYSHEHIPSGADIKIENGSGIGTFKNTITGLSSGTTYYVKTYCTNSEGTNYSSEVAFITN